MFFIPPTLLFLSLASFVRAGSFTTGQTCNQGENRLQIGTYEFYSECDDKNYCSAQGTCQPKGCRSNEFEVAWSSDPDKAPPKCQKGQFCPDEGDACQPLLAVDSPCQLNRDDECQPPPNAAQLTDKTGHGLNVDGAVCLNFSCMWANVTLGQNCVVENTAYTSYGQTDEYIDIVSRDNCQGGLYCDTGKKVCIATKIVGESCDADKECASYNCAANGQCAKDAADPKHVATWVYIVVGVAIFGGMFASLIAMFFLHGKQREVEREKRMQYWREQNAFRHNIMQMRETARGSVMSGNHSGTPSARSSTLYHTRGGSDDSHAPILQYAAGKASGLRNPVTDEDDDQSILGPQAQVNYRNPGAF